MRLKPHDVQTPAWTLSDYGEPVATYSEPVKVPMHIAWINAMRDQLEGVLYEQYEFVAITKSTVEIGSLIDGKYEVGYTQPGRFNRLFMNYAEGVEREYEQFEGDSSEHTEGSAD